MKVRFGMFWQSYGVQEIELPEEYENASDEEIQDYIYDHWRDIPLPLEESYIYGSDEPDFERFERISE